MIMLKKVVIGLLAGIISGFFSSGGGLILVPAFVHILKMDDKMARATSVFCIMPMVIATAFFYNKNNESYSLPKYTVIEDNKSLFKLMSPSDFFSSPASIDRIVLFPQPLGPTIETNSFSFTEKLTSFTASISVLRS